MVCGHLKLTKILQEARQAAWVSQSSICGATTRSGEMALWKKQLKFRADRRQSGNYPETGLWEVWANW
jgi:hypothetical protein